MRSKILLIGGTGYLGRHLKEWLRGIGDLYVTGSKEHPDNNFLKLDFLNERTYDNLIGFEFDIVIVLASTMTGIGRSNLNNNDLEVNVWGYKKFLQFVADKKLSQRIVYVSSMTVYSIRNSAPVREVDLINPINIYGLSKSMAELLTVFFSEHSNIKSVIVRIPGLFGGDRKSGFIHNVTQKCLKGEDVVVTTKDLGYWECIEINDFCNLFNDFLAAYKWEKPSDVFNFCYGEETDFVDTAYYIKNYVNSDSRIIESDTKGYVKFFLSNAKLKEIVKMKYEFRTSLRQYIDHLRTQ